MVKKMLVPVSLLALIAAAAGAYTITEFKGAPAVSLHVPVKPDSTLKENAFKSEDLLGARGAVTGAELPQVGWTTVETDTAGRVKLVGSKIAPTLSTYTTRLRSREYAKGNLVINTPGMAEVYANGKSVIKKTSSDSLPTDGSAQLELAPEADTEITVNILTFPDDKGTPEFKLEFVPEKEFENVELVSGPEIKRRLAPVNTMTGERVSRVSVSPDGKYFVTVYSQVFSAIERRSRATLTETATGRVLSENIDASSQWMPKGSTLYYAKDNNGRYDIYTASVPSMKSSLLAKSLPVSDFTITPDNKYIIYYKNVDPEQEAGPLHRVKSPDDRIKGDRDRSYIMRYDIASRVTQPLTYGGPTTGICDFTKDGSKMLYMSVRQTPSKYPFYSNSFVEMDLKTLATDTIISENPFINNAIYSPDGKQLFLVGSPQAFNGIGANQGNHEIPNDFDNQGFIYTIATGDVRPVTKEFDPSLEGAPVWNKADGNIYFRGEEGFFVPMFKLDPRSGKIEKLASKIDYVRGFSMGDDESRWIAYWGGGFTSDGEAWLYHSRNGASTLIDNPLAEELQDIEFGKMEPWKFTAKDGTEIDGYMCLPPEFDASKKYPLIVYYYGGTSPSQAAMYHLYAPQVFASRDYVVYVINPSGTTGYGQEFSARHVNAWGRQTADDIIEGVDKFCSAHPFVDRKRIGCLGASYGGFMTQYLQTLTDMFRCAVSHAGISNVTSYWGEGYWGYSYNSVAAAKSYPWTDPELYTKQGSLFNADKIHTPLLLLHGNQDTNVPIGESIQIFNALRVLGRDVEFITVDDENHVISNFDRKLLWQNTIMAWFAKYLKDDPRWWNSLYGK